MKVENSKVLNKKAIKNLHKMFFFFQIKKLYINHILIFYNNLTSVTLFL